MDVKILIFNSYLWVQELDKNSLKVENYLWLFYSNTYWYCLFFQFLMKNLARKIPEILKYVYRIPISPPCTTFFRNQHSLLSARYYCSRWALLHQAFFLEPPPENIAGWWFHHKDPHRNREESLLQIFTLFVIPRYRGHLYVFCLPTFVFE